MGRGTDDSATIELLERLAHREPGRPQPCPGVRGIAGAELRLEQGAQQLVGCPALDLGGDEDLGRQPPDRGQLQPAQGGLEVGGEGGGRRRRHATGSRAYAARDRTGTAGSLDGEVRTRARGGAGRPGPRRGSSGCRRPGTGGTRAPARAPPASGSRPWLPRGPRSGRARPRAARARGGGRAQERRRDRTQAQERDLGRGPGPDRPDRCGGRPGRSGHRGGSSRPGRRAGGGRSRVPAALTTSSPPATTSSTAGPDEGARDAVARRAEADGAQAVDRAHRRRRRCRAQRGQAAEQRAARR